MKEESTVKRYIIILALITFMALALRLIAGWQMYKTVPGVQNPISQTDMYTYFKYAKEFSEGTYDSHGGAYYYQPFYSAVFLRFLFTLFGSDPLAIVIAQALMGAFTVLLTGLIGARMGGKKAGIIAALILTIFRNHILYTPFALIAILQTFLITLTVYLAFLAFDRRKWQYWVFVGLTMSCSILSRGNFLLLVPFVLIFIWRVHKPGLKQVLVPMAAFLLAVYLPQMPFSIKNYQVTGKWTGPSIAGDVVIAIGNNPDAPPGTENLAGPHYLNYDEYDEFTHWRNNGDKELGDSLKSYIKSNPMEWLEKKFDTLSLYVSNHECYNNITLTQCVQHVPWLNSIVLLDYWIVAIPFLVLLVRTIFTRKFTNRKLNFILVTSIIYSAGIVIFYVLARYKLPLVPILCVCAGMEFVRWKHMLQSDNKRRKALLALTTLFAIFIVLRWFDIYHYNLRPSITKSLRPDGKYFEGKDAVYIKDISHALWGNWEPMMIEDRVGIQKSFVTPSEVSAPGVLRIFCGISDRGTIKVALKHAGKLYQKSVNYNRMSNGWIEIPIEKIISEQHKINFDLEVYSVTPAGVFYTTQSNYGRSSLNGQPLEGEWIMQLKIKK